MHRIRLSWAGGSKKVCEAKDNAIDTTPNDSLENERVRLPGEIWDMIWGLIIYSTPSRLVEIRHKKNKAKTIFTSPSAIPPVLHICSRSRALALRRWKLCLATKGECAKIFFDYETDVLYFGNNFRSLKLFKEEVGEEDRQKIRSTGFASRCFVDGTSGRALYLDMLSDETSGRQLRILDADDEELLIPP